MVSCLFLALVSCRSSGGGPSPAPVPSLASVPNLAKPVASTLEAANNVDKSLTDAEHVAGNLPASPDRVALVNDLGLVRRWFSTNLASLQTIFNSAGLADRAIADRDTEIKALEKKLDTATKEVISLKTKDPVRSMLTLIGIGAIVLGGGVLIASFFVAFLQGVPGLRLAATGVITFGLFVVTVAYYLTEIRWIVGITIVGSVVGGIVWLWLHRSILIKKAQAEASFSDVNLPTTVTPAQTKVP